MNLKVKLLTAFFIIILLPILLVTAAAGVIISYQVNSIQQDYDVDTDPLQAIKNPIQLLNRVTRGTYNEIKLLAIKNPKKLEDEAYIDELNQELVKKYSFLMVRKDKEFIYCGNRDKAHKIQERLPGFGVYNTEVDGGIYMDGQHPFLIKQQDFYFSDGQEGSIFVITDVNVIVPQLKWSAIQFVVAFVFIICLTACILVVWIYRGILKPLNKLRRATYEIQEGNLEYSISEDGDDEIGQLCRDFEEMRIRLKELIDGKLQNEKNTKELISNISHDLKTPLTAIKGYSEGIIDGVADTDQKRDKYLKTIYTKASDMSVLVDELLFYSKIDGNTMPYTFKNINISDYFSDCLDEYSLDAQVKNVQISYNNYLPPELKVVADAEQLKRVINNIVSNSVKYMGKKEGNINIQLQRQGEYVGVEFSDNGEGICANDLPHIFDRFYRADASRNSKKGGSGLGLAIAKKIIEEHGGTIWARSIEGMGTTIGFSLRISEEEKEYE